MSLAAALPSLVGLSDREAEERLAVDGPNEPFVARPTSVLGGIVRRTANPLVFILLFAAAASAVLHDYANAAIIVAMVLLSALLELFQTRRSERAFEALKARAVPTATVLRDGTWRELPRRDLVVGDVVKLAAGDLVPADAELLAAKDLHVNEAALTGESLPVEKEVGAAGDGSTVLLGSSVVSGTATARVSAIGRRTRFGAIAESLALRPPPTEFERGIARFGGFILRTVVFLTFFVLIVLAVAKHDPLESLMFAVALAVGLTPEFLPMITTVTLARGAVRMARAKVLVKNLGAIQNFGSIDVLCSDKTGTLTTGEMTLDEAVDARGESAERPLLYAYLNSFFESGVENALDTAVLRRAKLDALDRAVLQHAHPDISGYAKVDEMPFDFERRRVSVVAARAGEGEGSARELVLVTKGAPEAVLAVCTRVDVGGDERPLDAAARADAEAVHKQLAAKGSRVLGVAYARPSKHEDFDKTDEHDLVLAGFVTFVDPPRDDTREVLAKLRREGVRVKILTGDSELVAADVCARVGLDVKHLLTGAELDKMSDPALAARAEKAEVFARVTPAQKSRILLALKRRGHVVGFLGDGINDAPSLHAADVGISVDNATDVAKDAADIVLLDRHLGVLLAGILEGRRAFANVMKYLLMGTSSNFGNMFSMAAASLFLPFLPMLPTQLLLNNFLYDLAQVTIPTDAVDPSFVKKPRRWDIDLIRKFMIWIGPISSVYDLLTFYVLLRVFHADAETFHTGWFVESLATQTLVIFVIRTFKSPFKSRPSRALAATTVGVVVLGAALPFTPLGALLGMTPLPLAFFGFLALATATYLVFVELAKRAVLERVFA